MSKQNKKAKQNIESGVADSQPNSQDSSFSFEEIQKKAYEIYLEKGGSDFDNWIAAEEALRQNKNNYAAQIAQ